MNLFSYDNVFFNDRVRLHADRLRGTNEIQSRRRNNLVGRIKHTGNNEAENMNSEDFYRTDRIDACILIGD